LVCKEVHKGFARRILQIGIQAFLKAHSRLFSIA